MTRGLKPHEDHNPKHGGLFFMSTDYHHHLEGKLVEPGRFYLWLYDEYTRPLSAEQLRKAKGTVQWGIEDKAPRTPIELARDGERLEALPPRPLKLPITLTLRLTLPGNPPGTKPELFTFPFVGLAPEEIERSAPPAAEGNPTDHSGSGHSTAPPGNKSADTLERHPSH